MLKLCIDARMINNSGIGVYIKNYTKYILQTNNYELILLGKKNELTKEFGQYTNWYSIEFDLPIYSIKEQIQLPRIIPKCDIFWSPHYNIPLLPIRAKKRLVTIPDSAHLALSDTFGFSLIKKIYASVVFRAAAYFSDSITTISDFSKDEIIKYTSISPSKITVIHLGIDNDIFRKIQNLSNKGSILKKYNLPQKYILFVGNVKPHKNLRGLINAFQLIKNQLEEYKILIVGRKEGFITGDNEVFSLITELGLEEKITFTGYVSNEDLPFIYNFASVFVFPSIYEGFGFPPLEAMACGCPVITTKKASMPEICEDAVEYIEIEDINSLADAIIQTLENEEIRIRLILKGDTQYKKFSWQNSGHSFIKVLDKLV